MDKLYAGVGRAVITPELGCHLAGYADNASASAEGFPPGKTGLGAGVAGAVIGIAFLL